MVWTGYEDLNSFMEDLKKNDELVEIDKEMAPGLEIAHLLGALGDRGGPAVLFNNVRGFPGTKIVGNIMGHRRRIAMALGTDELHLIDTFIERVQQRIAPTEVDDGPVKDVVIKKPDVNLTKLLPAMVHHEKDAAPYLTCAVTFARDPETGLQSMGMHRIQILSKNTMTICLASPPLADFLAKAQKMGKDLEVAVALGSDPGIMIASVVWCPSGVDKLEIAGALNQQSVEIIPAETVHLRVPSQAQYIIEGMIHPNELASEKQFGDSSGIYVKDVASPVIHVTSLSHRESPIFQELQTWSAEDDALFDLSFGTKMLQDAKQIFPFVLDVCLAKGTCAAQVNVKFAPVAAAYRRAAICYILSTNPFIKSVIAVDEDINPRNPSQVEWALATRFQADRDLILLPNLQGSIIDPSAGPSGITCKVGIDATYPKEKEAEFEKIDVPEDIKKRVSKILEQHYKG